MKKFRTIMMTVLAMLMVLFCFASCGKTGKYTATAYKAGPVTIDLTDSTSYIELKSDDVAVLSIDIVIGKIDGTGTWAEGEDGAIVITVDNIKYDAVVDGKTLTLDIFGTSVVFEKE